MSESSAISTRSLEGDDANLTSHTDSLIIAAVTVPSAQNVGGGECRANGESSAAADKVGVGGGSSSAKHSKAFINMPLPELYQRRLLMLRELNMLEDAIKSLEAQQHNQTSAMTGSLAAALDERLKAMGDGAAANSNNGASEATQRKDGEDDDEDHAVLDGLFKEVMRKNTSLLVAAYGEAHGVDSIYDANTTPIFVPPRSIAEATRRNATAFALGLIKRATTTLSGLKECNRITELVCSPAGFAGDEVPKLPSIVTHESLTRYFALLSRLHFRQLFIAEAIRHSRHLVTDALGSAMLQRTIPLMVSGTVLPGNGSSPIGASGALWFTIANEEISDADSLQIHPVGGGKMIIPTTTKMDNATLWDCVAQLNFVASSFAPTAERPSELLVFIATLGSPTLADAACHTHGTRAILRIAEHIRTVPEYEAFLMSVEGDTQHHHLKRQQAEGTDVGSSATSELSSKHSSSGKASSLCLTSKFISLLIDMNGNSVVNKILTSPLFAEEGDASTSTGGNGTPDASPAAILRSKVYGVIAAKCLDVCRNRQGCCTIQRCIVGAPEPYKQQMVDVVLSNALKLVQDPFGNYVIQFLLDGNASGVEGSNSGASNKNNANSKKQPSKYTNLIIRQLLHHIPTLSTNKFSSNVIEKCLRSASSDVKQLLIDELTEPQALPKLLVDSFANYVVQTAIESAADEQQFKQLRDAIAPLQHLLKNSPYGGKIETRLERRQRDIHNQKRILQQQQSMATAHNSLSAVSNGVSVHANPNANGMMADGLLPSMPGGRGGGGGGKQRGGGRGGGANMMPNGMAGQPQQYGNSGRGRGGAAHSFNGGFMSGGPQQRGMGGGHNGNPATFNPHSPSEQHGGYMVANGPMRVGGGNGQAPPMYAAPPNPSSQHHHSTAHIIHIAAPQQQGGGGGGDGGYIMTQSSRNASSPQSQQQHLILQQMGPGQQVGGFVGGVQQQGFGNGYMGHNANDAGGNIPTGNTSSGNFFVASSQGVNMGPPQGFFYTQ